MTDPIFSLPVGKHHNIIFDVGANTGVDGLGLAANNPGHHVFAFEPTPEMIETIRGNYAKFQAVKPFSNYTLIPKAVSDFCGTATFNVAGQADWGCSSLNTFAKDLDKTWPERTDFKVTHTIEVAVTTLGAFCEEHGIAHIAYLHCDTQGSDLKVLRGLGKYRRILHEGIIEVASSRSVALYEDQHLLEDVVFEFPRWNYEIVKITHNDIHCNEVNVRFRNRQPEVFEVRSEPAALALAA